MRYDKMLKRKTVLITGGAASLVSAFAALFARHGARLSLAGLSVPDTARIKGELKAYGAGAEFFSCDFTKPEQTSSLCLSMLGSSGAPDVWLHAADEYGMAYIDDMDMQALERMFALSVTAPFQIMKAFAQPMVARGDGSVIFVSSQYGAQAMNRVSGYGAAKGAEISLAHAFALEYASSGIRVNALVQGASIPPVGDDLLRQSGEADDAEFWGTVQPFPRRGTPEELANAALFLASDMASYITGETLYVDGAEHLIAHNHLFPRKDKVLP